MRLQGKTALITGAASGIGRATAELFAREGAVVWVTDRDGDGATAVAQAIGGRAAALDVTREEDWVRCLDGLELDVLVANAGVSHGAPLRETSLDDWRRVMAVNLDGVFLGVKHGLRAMRGTPLEIAQAILFLASDESPTVTGAELAVDSGFTAS